MSHTAIQTPNAPAAVGPYSQAIRAGNFVFCSGQLPLVPATGKIIEGDTAAQAEQSLKNLGAILKEAGLDYKNVVRATVYLTDLKDFQSVNAVYAKFFSAPFPARVCFEAKALPLGAKVEIDAIAVG